VKQHTKDAYVIPAIIGVVLLFAGLPLSAWYTRQPVRAIVTWVGIKDVLFAKVSAWTDSVLLLTLTAAGYLLYRTHERYKRTEEQYKEVQRESSARYATNLTLVKHMQEKEREHEAELKAIENKEPKTKEPKLHSVWNNSQTFWHLGRRGQEPIMQIGGWIDLTSSNTEEVIYLLAAYIDGHRSDMSIDMAVKPNTVNREQVMLYMIPPLETDPTKPFTATVVVEDQYNRKYELPVQTFRATPGQPPPPPPKVEKPSPVLHASWLGDSAWGWASSHSEQDPIYMIRGDVTLLMDGIVEPVIITGVEIEGSEPIGNFDNFQLTPNQPETRRVQVYFRGKAPKGIDDYAVQLVFKDIRGSRYPTVEHRFKPLSIPERVGIERGQHFS
jgi:hypothetical protein